MNYKFLYDTVIAKIDDDGISRSSCGINDSNYLEWLSLGNTPLPADPILPSQIWEKIKQKRDDLQLNGGVKIGTNWFLTTDRAVGEYTALALISAGLPDTTVLRAGWRTMNGTLIDMTPLLVKQILTAGFTQIAAIDTVSQNHKAAMELSTTPETYDFSAGWPLVYIP